MTTATTVATATTTKKLVNLTSSNNHASILFATDEWFATAENLLNPTPPTFAPDLFCNQGKVMDGWETRRRRSAGHDWCVIKLSSGESSDDDDGDGSRGANDNASYGGNGPFAISRVEIDTAYFTGNQAPRVSIEAMRVTRTTTNGNGGRRDEREEGCDENENENDDHLYDWMPGASTRLARGGSGVRGTGRSPAAVRRAAEACRAAARRTLPRNASGEWIAMLPMTPLRPGYEDGRHHAFELSDGVKSQIRELGGVTHLKLNYHPDGGVARLKVYGQSCPQVSVEEDQEDVATALSTDSINTQRDMLPTIHPHGSSSNPPPSANPYPHPELSSELLGGLGLACSNKHYGEPANLLRPYPGEDMGDGWETARHPDRPALVSKDPITGLQDTALMDWSVVKLGLGGAEPEGGVSRIIVDTRHFKGNFPESVAVDGCYADPGVVSDEAVCTSAGEAGSGDNEQQHKLKSLEWFPLLRRTPLTADAEHEFLRECGHVANGQRGVTHVRISITPDGGLSRVRVYGSPTGESLENVVPPSRL